MALAWCLTAAAALPAVEPVDDLRQELKRDVVANPNPAQLKNREDRLTDAIDKLETIGQKRRGLTLEEWLDTPAAQLAHVSYKIVDSRVRGMLGKRLVDQLHKAAQSANVEIRKSVAITIVAMNASVRSFTTIDKNGNVVLADNGGFARHLLLPMLETLCEDKDRAVRLEALRAVGNINPAPDKAGPILGKALQRRANDFIGERRVAADGLAQMVRVAAYLRRTQKRDSAIIATHDDVLEVVTATIRASASGLNDPDPGVRRYCAVVTETGAAALADMVNGMVGPIGLPQINLNTAVGKAKPSLDGLRQQLDALRPLFEDRDVRVRIQAALALSEIAAARQRFCLLVLEVPGVAPADRVKHLANDPMDEFLNKQLGTIDRLLSDSDVEVRKAAAVFLVQAAAPLIQKEHANPLTRRVKVVLGDRDSAVRFVAARTLGNLLQEEHANAIDPALIKAAVPSLVKQLSDTVLIVRVTAAETLNLIGSFHADDAIEALALAATRDDADGRIAALTALNQFRLAKAKPAVQQLVVEKMIFVLGETGLDAKVLAGAAKTLEQLGPAAKTALPALRRLTGDDDAMVSAAAAQAILAIE